eukprot:CAMPEP_0203753230 /NCGR_PEP_ID=MMETSP0098-20131031/7031_1 /ASSEMBLY_ACC=CAM_ASM_000208 /TAXON_ID=96639 /ORGANISM=" , Strain NY0313808BC1" /LENGTH=283 /DNA_ID=CAMNT_0050643731 /DNA_START=120 /DNA_END=968 /DNA_ORIENTATION=+
MISGPEYDGMKPVNESKGVAPGTMVVDAVPIVEDQNALAQKYAAQGVSTAEFEAVTAEVVPAGDFFSPTEMQQMNLLPVPMALDYDAANNLPQEGEPADESSIIYHNDGAMPVIPSAWSIARVQRDAAKRGIKSTDTEVLCNKLEILKFLNQHNTRPYMGINVEGYHTETYYRNRNGKRERHTRRVTDFAYTIDMTHFIYPYGKIHSNTESSVEEMIEEFLKDDNKLRSLQVKKRVYWNEAGLISLVRMYIRRMGWNRGLTVRPEYSNKSIRVCTDSKLAATW